MMPIKKEKQDQPTHNTLRMCTISHTVMNQDRTPYQQYKDIITHQMVIAYTVEEFEFTLNMSLKDGSDKL